MSRQRLSVSVDADLAEAVEAAVQQGEAPTLSAWVNAALRLKLDNDRRLRALAKAIAAFEVKHGEITDEEIARAQRAARARAIHVRGRAGAKPASTARTLRDAMFVSDVETAR